MTSLGTKLLHLESILMVRLVQRRFTMSDIPTPNMPQTYLRLQDSSRFDLEMPWVSHVLFWPDPAKLLPVFHLELIAAELHVPSSNPLSRLVIGTKTAKECERDII